MNDMNDDFELPPLPKETVFSSEVGDIDEEMTEPQPMI